MAEHHGDMPNTDDKSSRTQRSEQLWIGVHFECCDVYTRVYRKPEIPEYRGRCPRCGRAIRVAVGTDGVNSRIFRATPGR